MIVSISGYRFLPLSDLSELKRFFTELCTTQDIKGTILLSKEGININLSGEKESIEQFKHCIAEDERFSGIRFHYATLEAIPYKRLKVKIKKEIITFRQSSVSVNDSRAKALPPSQLKQWLDEGREVVLLDTRNEYEVEMGTFDNAVNLHLDHFTELPDAIQSLEKDKTIVMFCTGGIRCEKAALYMQQTGFSDVYQLDGGILGYFNQVGGEHYHGDCFVFDERVKVSASNSSPV